MAQAVGRSVTGRPLSVEERRRFEDAGYVVAHDMAPIPALLAARRIAQRLLRRHAGRNTGDFLDLVGDDEDPASARSPQILMPAKFAPELAESPLRAVAWSVARNLLGETVEYQGEHLIAKPPRRGAATPPHQDEAFWSGGLDYCSISIWFPLQDVGETDGCLFFAPGSHRSGVRRHRPAGGDLRSNSFELAEELPVPVLEPMRLGALSVHDCRTIHGAGANLGRRARFAYIYGFGRPAQPARRPRELPWLKLQATSRQARAQAGGYSLTKMRPEA